MSRRKRKSRKKRNRAAENRARNRRTTATAKMKAGNQVDPQTIQSSENKTGSIAEPQHDSTPSLDDDNNSEQELIEEAESIIHKAANDEPAEDSDDGDPDSSQSSEDSPIPAESEDEVPETDDSIPGFDVNDLDDGEFVDDEDDYHSDENENDIDESEEEDTDEPDTATFADIEDEVLSSDDGSGVVRSVTNLKDSLITYETEGFINPDTGKPYNRFHLMSHPVKLVFKQHVQGDDPDEYESVRFVVNRSLAYELSVLFENIRRSYDGQPLDRKDRVKEKLSWSSVRKSAVRMVRDHLGRVIMTAVLIATVIIILFAL